MTEPGPCFTAKYTSRNPVSRWLVEAFFRSLRELVAQVAPTTIFEVGCGEGYLALDLARHGYRVAGGELRPEAVAAARRQAQAEGLVSRASFTELDIFQADMSRITADLMVCCEVLEHLSEPERALAIMAGSPTPWLLASVPREPFWRGLNLCRMKYPLRLGNTPGHLNHWTRGGFLRFLESHYDIVAVRSPLPWTMVLARRRPSGKAADGRGV